MHEYVITCTGRKRSNPICKKRGNFFGNLLSSPTWKVFKPLKSASSKKFRGQINKNGALAAFRKLEISDLEMLEELPTSTSNHVRITYICMYIYVIYVYIFTYLMTTAKEKPSEQSQVF